MVEIIFQSSWGRLLFAGMIEMLFQVQHPPQAIVSFEEYCSIIHNHTATSNAAHCTIDGNEMMHFHCTSSSASTSGSEDYDATVWGKMGEGIWTFDGSGEAHESGGCWACHGAMLLC
ncbi:hypothetical protein COCNU_scaffold000708G000010 [Cocos nucifera]|nr:hypothetical protein [Cocos nucifera]